MRDVTVPLGARTYSISVGRKLLPQLGRRCASLDLGSRCAIISDANVAKRYAADAEKSLRRAGFEVARIVLPDDPAADAAG